MKLMMINPSMTLSAKLIQTSMRVLMLIACEFRLLSHLQHSAISYFMLFYKFLEPKDVNLYAMYEDTIFLQIHELN